MKRATKTTASKSPPIKRKRPAVKRKASSVKRKSRQIDTLEILDAACCSLTELYPTDATVPGVVIAWLPKKGQFYASFARYEDGKKVVLCSAYGATLAGAIEAVVGAWMEGTKVSRKLRGIGQGLNHPDRDARGVFDSLDRGDGWGGS